MDKLLIYQKCICRCVCARRHLKFGPMECERFFLPALLSFDAFILLTN